MKRKDMNPLEYSFQHTRERALERYGFDLTRADYDKLTNLVREDLVGRCFPDYSPRLKKVNQEGSQSTFIVPSFKGKTLVAVFDAGRALVTTLLPPSDFAPYWDF